MIYCKPVLATKVPGYNSSFHQIKKKDVRFNMTKQQIRRSQNKPENKPSVSCSGWKSMLRKWSAESIQNWPPQLAIRLSLVGLVYFETNRWVYLTHTGNWLNDYRIKSKHFELWLQPFNSNGIRQLFSTNFSSIIWFSSSLVQNFSSVKSCWDKSFVNNSKSTRGQFITLILK